MRLVPLPERRRVDLHHRRFGEGVGADKLVVGRVESYDDDAHFAGHALGAPGEVAGVDAQGTVFLVAAARADEMDTLGTDTGVGGLAAFLECSVDELVGLFWQAGLHGFWYLFLR